MYKISTQAKI